MKMESLKMPEENDVLLQLKKALTIAFKKKKPTSGKGRWVTMRGRKVFLKPGEKFSFGNKKGEYTKSTTESDKKIVGIYQDGGYQTINGYLRGDKGVRSTVTRNKDTKLIEGRIGSLDNLINKTDKRSVILSRGDKAGATSVLFENSGITKELKNAPKNHAEFLSGKAPNGESYNSYFASKLKGQIFQDKGFVSTSADKNIASQFAQGGNISKYGMNTLITITGKTKGLKVDSISGMGAKEAEFLLPRNTKFMVKTVKIRPVQMEGYSGESGEAFVMDMTLEIL